MSILRKVPLIFAVLLCLQAPAQNYKTIADTNFVVGDFIKPPLIYFNLSGGGGVYYKTIDSVKAVAEFLKKNENLIVEIGVHSDYRGSEEYNINLTQRRADTLRNLLIKEYSIPFARLEAKGYGESKPISTKLQIDVLPPEEKEQLLSINRRIELKVLKVL